VYNFHSVHFINFCVLLQDTTANNVSLLRLNHYVAGYSSFRIQNKQESKSMDAQRISLNILNNDLRVQ